MDAGLLTAEDRFAINDCLARYCLALDDQRFDGLDEVFVRDLVWDYGPYGAGHDRASLVALVTAALTSVSGSQHMLGTSTAEATPDGARARTYVMAQHVHPDADGGPLLMAAGWYRDELVRTPDGWRIARRTYEHVWTQGNLGMFGG